MLYKSINACRYPFTFSTVVHSGKPKAEPTSYYTPGTSQTVQYLFQNLECHTNLAAVFETYSVLLLLSMIYVLLILPVNSM